MERISLNHLNQLMKWLYDKVYTEHMVIYNLEDRDDVYERLSKMSDKQYYYFFSLLSKKQWFKIKDLLDNFLTHK
jgi:Mg/Co/Ni transporter MgtE